MLIINYLAYVFMNFVATFYWSFCLKKRFPKISNVIYALTVFLLLVIPSTVKFFASEESFIFYLSYYLGIVLLIAFFFVGYSNHFLIIILFFITWISEQNVSEMLTFAICRPFGIETETVDFNTFDTSIMMAVDSIILLIFVFFHSILWNLVFNKKRTDGKTIWLFALLPISHCAMIMTVSAVMNKNKTTVQLAIAGVLLVIMLLDIVYIVFIMHQTDKAEKLLEIGILQKKMETEEAKYEELKEKVDEAAMLRHDYKNQLAMLRYLLESGKVEEAKAALGKK